MLVLFALLSCGARPTPWTPPPGVEAVPTEVVTELRAALAAKGADYVPRTRHLQPDGSPTYTNRLVQQSSPYLLQHAHNPVDWHPWGDEAFAKAKALDLPVFLSVGYSTCHWCHVMEEESFEDVEIARFLNEHFVCIKVDREERPDVDAVYMAAVHAARGRGGWPMSVFMNAEREPFFTGTYFPPRDGVRGSRMGFLTILNDIDGSWRTDRDRLHDTARRLADAVQRSFRAPPAGDVPGFDAIDSVYSTLEPRFDDRYGGLNRAPKFPSNVPVRLLLRHYRRTGEVRALQMATMTLDKMAGGGMYDQVGGGFHRYSVDKQWLVPHFEKMLYDNALLVSAYLDGYTMTGNAVYADVVREILLWVQREMTDPGGAFYSAQDADSPNPDKHGEREEGWFYTWEPVELQAVLGSDSAAFSKAYGVTSRGNFEGRNILHWPRRLDHPDRAALVTARETLYLARADRPWPLRDDKILTSWNGLMIGAHARAAVVLNEPRYAERAEAAAAYLLARRDPAGRLPRTVTGGQASGTAFLDDYAFLAAGLLDLFEATGDPKWVREAIALDDVLQAHFEDDAGGWFLTPSDGETLLAREKPDRDGAEPSGNAVHVMTLLRLAALTSDDRYRVRADAALGAFALPLSRAPTSLTEMLLALDFRLSAPKEIVMVTPSDRAAARPFLDVLGKAPLPNHVLAVVEADGVDAAAGVLPVIGGKRALDGEPTVYVCQGGVCDRPTTDPAVFRTQVLPSTEPSSLNPSNPHEEPK